MNRRIESLVELSKKIDMIPEPVAVEYDPKDYALPEPIFNAKRIMEYINGQTVYITDSNRFTGMLRYWGGGVSAGVPGDSFMRSGHTFNAIANKNYYCKYQEELVCKEWQHGSPNYKKIIDKGIIGVLKDIEFYKNKYRFEKDKYLFLEAEEIVCKGVIQWAYKCADECKRAAETCSDEVRKNELIRLYDSMRNVPENPAESFYEGLCTIIFCFYFLPDSVGTLDRYLYKLYKNDIENNVLTREEAKELLQEFFVYLSNYTPPTAFQADKSAECHFAIGGYLENGEDGFNELSRLIVEALMEIDTRRPALSLRWNKKIDYENFKFYADCLRKDKNNRLAIVNDEPRIKGLMNILGFSFSEAVSYTTVGCNEIALPGAMECRTTTTNLMRSLVNTLYKRSDESIGCTSFDQFFDLYSQELTKDFD